MPVVHSAQTMRISWLRLTPSPSGPKRTSTRPTSPCSSNGCPQNDSQAYCTFGTNLQRNRNELPFDPCHLGVPSGLPKRISETIACLAQTVHLSCMLINTFSKWTKTIFHLPHHLGGPSGATNISMLVVYSTQTLHLFGAEINNFSKQSKVIFQMTYVT
jgi:hypothetical protein